MRFYRLVLLFCIAILFLPAYATMGPPEGPGSDPVGLNDTQIDETEAILEEFGEGWIYIYFPGVGIFSLTDVTTEGTDGWTVLQAFGGSLNDFVYLPMMTPAPTAESGGIVVFMPRADGCGGDFNNDGSVNLFDLYDYVRAYGSEDDSADLNNDAQINYFDLMVFLGNFASGC
jgi:hypothetical protein